jgi:hypothetical protein
MWRNDLDISKPLFRTGEEDRDGTMERPASVGPVPSNVPSQRDPLDGDHG